MDKIPRSRERHKRLSSVFPKATGMSHRIARISVLLEDLQIETSGILPDCLGGLDEASHKVRKFYFYRRSIGTLVELAEALRLLEGSKDFDRWKALFRDREDWIEAVRYFGRKEPLLRKIRNDICGHFGEAAARHAVKNLAPEAVGRLELVSNGEFFKPIFHFAGEIAATAILKHLDGADIEDKIRNLQYLYVESFQHAVRAAACIVELYLWERFE